MSWEDDLLDWANDVGTASGGDGGGDGGGAFDWANSGVDLSTLTPGWGTGYGTAMPTLPDLTVMDSVTGQTYTLAQAYQLDPNGLKASLAAYDPTGVTAQALFAKAAADAGASPASPGGEVPGGVAPGANGQTYSLPANATQGLFGNNPPLSPGAGSGGAPDPGALQALLTKLGADPAGTAKLVGQGTVGAVGLGTMLAGLVRSNNQGQVTLSNGRTVQLTPQEQQLASYVLSQAQAQSGVAGAINPAVQGAANAAGTTGGPIQSTLTGNAQTAANQAGGQVAVSQAGATAVGAGAPGAFTGDITNANAMQPVQGRAIQSLADLGPGGNYATGPQYDPLQANATAADQVVALGLAGNIQADPAIQKMQDAELAQLDQQAKNDLGPGYNYSTAYQTKRDAIVQKYDLMKTQDMRNQVTLAQSVSQQNAGFLQNTSQQKYTNTANLAGSVGSATDVLGKVFNTSQAGAPTAAGGTSFLLGNNPSGLGIQGLGSLTPIGTTQQQIGLTTDLANAQLNQANNAGTAKLGGTLLGVGASPFLTASANGFKAIS